jgi:DNA-binding CsgD family transcriptional regulator
MNRPPRSEAGTDLVIEGRAALAAGDWDRARSCFERALDQRETAEALDGLGRALHFQAEYARAIELSERAFAAYRTRGMVVEAAHCARWLVFLHAAVNANIAAASGWMGRADTLLADVEECAVHGWVTLDHAPLTDDAGEREQLASAALAIGRRYGDADLEFDALALLGEAYVASGRVAKGMQMIDQAMAAVSSGEVGDVVAVSDILCRLLGACETSLDIARAEQWMSVAVNFEAWSEFVSPVCRSHYGGLLVATGRWSEAEDQLEAAIRTFERSYRLMREAPLVKLAELRLRQGRFEEARRLLEGSESHPIGRRVLAAIALARSELELAEDLARLCLDGQRIGDPGCAPALELLVQIRLARADTASAAEALEQLSALASRSSDARAAAYAELATGRISAARGHTDAAAHQQVALRRFTALGLPYEAARAQLQLAHALADTSPEAAGAEARSALRAFEQLGATADADAAAALLRPLGGPGRSWPKGRGTLTKRETEVLSLLASGCSNAEIAQRLYISRRTAEHHVAHILSKLDLRSRAEAAAYAVRELAEDQ